MRKYRYSGNICSLFPLFYTRLTGLPQACSRKNNHALFALAAVIDSPRPVVGHMGQQAHIYPAGRKNRANAPQGVSPSGMTNRGRPGFQ